MNQHRHGKIKRTRAVPLGVSGWTFGDEQTVASFRARPHDPMVRARAFEIIDENGKAISYWGADKDSHTILAFGGNGSASPERIDISLPAELADPRRLRMVIGVVGEHPFLDLNAPDGETRMRLNLSVYDKPILWMADEAGKRLSLGVEHSDTPSRQDNNWALDFGPERARIGMFTTKERGQAYIHGVLLINRDKVKYP